MESTLPPSEAITTLAQSKPPLPWWLIVVIVVVALLVVVAIIGVVYMMCFRKKAADGAHRAPYRAANIDDQVADANP